MISLKSVTLQSAMRSQLERDVLPIWWQISEEGGRQVLRRINKEAGTSTPAIPPSQPGGLLPSRGIKVAAPEYCSILKHPSYIGQCNSIFCFAFTIQGINFHVRNIDNQEASLILGRQVPLTVRNKSRVNKPALSHWQVTDIHSIVNSQHSQFSTKSTVKSWQSKSTYSKVNLVNFQWHGMHILTDLT